MPWAGACRTIRCSLTFRPRFSPVGGLLALVLGWQAVAWRAGSIVLPGPGEVAARLPALLADPASWQALATTAADALGGLAVGGGIGLAAGLLAGAGKPLGAAMQPVATVLLGVPQIAWVVLALLWLGPTGAASGATVAVACAPMLFLGTWHGLRARDPALAEMGRVFGLSPRLRLTEIALPQIASHVRAALATALGMSFKVAVMAEVLSGGLGVGGRIATARAYLQTDVVLAWIVLTVALLLALQAAAERALR